MQLIRSACILVAMLALLLVQSTSFALACPDGQSRGAFGWCYPNIGGTVGQTFEAAKKGDWNTVARGVGDVLITAKCPLCAVVGQAVLKKEDRALISTIVGRGVILSSVGVPSILVVADGVTGVAQTVSMRGRSAEQPISQPPTPVRARKSFTVETVATCMIESIGDDSKITAGWVSAPAFVDDASHTPLRFPEVDLQKGDILKVRANDCPEYKKVPGQISISQTHIVYDDSQIVPGAPGKMKFFIWGQSERATSSR